MAGSGWSPGPPGSARPRCPWAWRSWRTARSHWAGHGGPAADASGRLTWIRGCARPHQDSGDPVISVDTKKKELVGEFANAGREWRPKGQPAAVRTHDFPGDSAGKAIPYGIYDVTADAGWVNVGTDHDTAAFAVESIRRWWNACGSQDYPDARRLL